MELKKVKADSKARSQNAFNIKIFQNKYFVQVITPIALAKVNSGF
jgi:hypothetical protein